MKQLIDRFLSAVRRKRDVSFWYHPSYECPTIMKHNKVHGVVHDRGKKLLSHLLHENLIDMNDIHPSPWVGLSVLGLFHSRDYLESLESPQPMGRIFGLKPQEVDIDELVGFQRRGSSGARRRNAARCGGIRSRAASGASGFRRKTGRSPPAVVRDVGACRGVGVQLRLFDVISRDGRTGRWSLT